MLFTSVIFVGGRSILEIYIIVIVPTAQTVKATVMPTDRFEPSSIRNKLKREEISRKNKKAKGQQKLQRRLAQAKLEANDPAAKKVGFAI